MNNEELLKRVERETRHLIGDQAIQIMVLRAALELQQTQQPREQPKPQPIPPQPEPPPKKEEPEPDDKERELLHVRKTNGAHPPQE